MFIGFMGYSADFTLFLGMMVLWLFCLVLGWVNFWIINGLYKKKRWAWIAALILACVYFTSIFLPLGAIALIGLLNSDVTSEFSSKSKNSNLKSKKIIKIKAYWLIEFTKKQYLITQTIVFIVLWFLFILTSMYEFENLLFWYSRLTVVITIVLECIETFFMMKKFWEKEKSMIK
jgi:hypothetical protein